MPRVITTGVLLDPLYVRRLLDPSNSPRPHLLDVLHRSSHSVLTGADLPNSALQTGQVRQHSHHGDESTSVEGESFSSMRTCRLRSCGRVAYVHADVVNVVKLYVIRDSAIFISSHIFISIFN